MKVVFPTCCGVDVHKTFVVATIITTIKPFPYCSGECVIIILDDLSVSVKPTSIRKMRTPGLTSESAIFIHFARHSVGAFHGIKD